MKMIVLCVKDRATEAFGTPMFMMSNGQAIRSFTDEVNREQADNQLYQHPDDFDMYVCGEFDTNTGLFECSTPVVLVRGKDVSINSRNSN